MAHALSTLPPSREERRASGRNRRKALPRKALAMMGDAPRDPLAIIDEQNVNRLQELVPLRAERMGQNAFAFYRGGAAIMAADLAAEPHTGILVPSCGDAHVANFGFYASPQRTLMFDLNDFDESAWAPWEWDLKRLLASVVIAGQSTSRDEGVVRNAVISAVMTYATAMHAAAEAAPMQRYFTHFDATLGTANMDPKSRKVFSRAIKQARKRTGERASRKLTQRDEHGVLRFVAAPPTMAPVTDEVHAILAELMQRYLLTAGADINMLLRHYSSVDLIRRVVGVGSVGTRCALSLFEDGDGNSLILQSKQAEVSVLARYGGIEQPAELSFLVDALGEGARVVAMQRILQAVSDPFLGSLRHTDEANGELDFYVRQFHDMKGGIDIEVLDDGPFATYAQACAITLARAHAQAPQTAEISGYLGTGKAAGKALFEWSKAYAQRSREDYEEFVARSALP